MKKNSFSFIMLAAIIALIIGCSKKAVREEEVMTGDAGNLSWSVYETKGIQEPKVAEASSETAASKKDEKIDMKLQDSMAKEQGAKVDDKAPKKTDEADKKDMAKHDAPKKDEMANVASKLEKMKSEMLDESKIVKIQPPSEPQKVPAAEPKSEPKPEMMAKVEKPAEPKADKVTAETKKDELASIVEKEGKLYTVYFDFDKFFVRDDMKPFFEKNAEWLKKNTAVKIQIEGSCDERGSDEYNMALGDRRALSAKKYLVNLGIDESRISTISYGEEKPVCKESNESCWSQNRRADFVVK